MDEVKRAIRRRLNTAAGTPAPPNEEDDDKAEAAKHDPAADAAYLVKWRPSGGGQSDEGYFLGSTFAATCRKDRATHLRALTTARDPFICVAGAVYLCFENEKSGMAELEKLEDLDGDPGVWAALNLARRGDKRAVERMLHVFATPPDTVGMAGAPNRNLRKRVLVLLSNSAKASGLPQPQPPYEADPYRITDDEDAARRKRMSEANTAYFLKWFRDHRGKLRMHDPWLAELTRKKVD